MPGSRRGRSRGPGELTSTLGGLIRSALGQAGVVRDVLERGAREGRARLDDARLERQRSDALAELGQAVLDAVHRGDLADLEELPEIAHAIAAIEDIDARLEEHEDRRKLRGRDDAVAATRRTRFDQGETPWQRVREDDDEHGAERRARPPRPSASDDGTVSSADWRPPRPGMPQKVWRPPLDTGEETAVDRPARRPTTKEPAAPEDKAKPEPRRPAPRAGGISFTDDEDEEDLQSYMHPDDVPGRERDK